MTPGYCYLYTGRLWRKSDSEAWDIEVYTPSGDEIPVGFRAIDGANCCVYRCWGGAYRAQTVEVQDERVAR